MITEEKIKAFIGYWREQKEYNKQLGRDRMVRDYSDLIEMGNLALYQMYDVESRRRNGNN